MAPKHAPKVLFAEDVTLATVSVSIKTVTVNNRQMTQSLFKQLESLDFIDYERCAIARGVVWGYVNYMAEPGVKQFLVQSGDKLYRTPVALFPGSSLSAYVRSLAPEPFRKIHKNYVNLSQAYYWALTGLELLNGGMRRKDGYLANNQEDPILMYTDHGYGHVTSHFYPKYKYVYNIERQSDLRNRVFHFVDLDDVRAQLERSLGSALDAEPLAERVFRAIGELDNYISKWDVLMNRLNEVEQLFIAA